MTQGVALITGCSSGIGEATAARLAKGDWTVYATARRPETMDGLAGPMKRLGGGPDAVAKVIEKSLNAKRPKIRYTVTPSTSLSIAARKLLGARGWDAAMGQQFAKPGK